MYPEVVAIGAVVLFLQPIRELAFLKVLNPFSSTLRRLKSLPLGNEENLTI
jgi:hypothetical protein